MILRIKPPSSLLDLVREALRAAIVRPESISDSTRRLAERVAAPARARARAKSAINHGAANGPAQFAICLI